MKTKIITEMVIGFIVTVVAIISIANYGYGFDLSSWQYWSVALGFGLLFCVIHYLMQGFVEYQQDRLDFKETERREKLAHEVRTNELELQQETERLASEAEYQLQEATILEESKLTLEREAQEYKLTLEREAQQAVLDAASMEAETELLAAKLAQSYRMTRIEIQCQSCNELNKVDYDLSVEEFECASCDRKNNIYVTLNSVLSA